MIIPVVLAGGSGTRLWPLSRESCPKQFLPLLGQETMLQETLRRIGQLGDLGRPIVVCTELHRFMVAEQVRSLGLKADIILEPADLDTAPAVAVAALHAREPNHRVCLESDHGVPQDVVPRDRLHAPAQEDDPLLLVMPSDHQIQRVAAFAAAVQAGAAPALDGNLITFGITPDHPETGYGYIKPAVERPGRPLAAGEEKAGADPDFFVPNVYPVARFVEKPDAATARQYVEQGCLWNSGIFLVRASVLLDQLAQFEPEMWARMNEAHQGRIRERDFIRLKEAPFNASPARSLDRAVLERTQKALVIPLSCGWRDVGSWAALWESGEADEDGNILLGQVVSRNSRNCYGHATSRLLALLGVEDLVVVETPDAVLVTRRSCSQEVRDLVQQLKDQGLDG